VKVLAYFLIAGIDVRKGRMEGDYLPQMKDSNE
jgi:hypothetical protein